MQLFDSLDKIEKPFPNAAITIGNFDGVHIGHQALLHETIERAGEMQGTSIVVTFEPHPLRVLVPNGHPPLITLNEQKTELIERAGIDVLVRVPFTRSFAAISAEAFIADILVARMGCKVIVVGQDFTFARNREGTIAYLRERQQEYGYEVIIPEWIQSPGTLNGRISSTRIRELVEAGSVADAQQLLGRFYQIRGRVAEGRNRGGKLLGFPTANIRLVDELCPKTGIYAVTVELGGQKLKGVANIGYSPTFDDHLFTVEVHILDFNRDVYDQDIRVNFIRRIRDEIRFSSIEELSAQISDDVEVSRRILEKK